MKVYLIRNLETLQNAYNSKIKESEQLIKEREILSCTGEEHAKKMSMLPYLKELDAIYSSNYVSALSSAKYIAKENNLKIDVNPAFQDRKVDSLIGVDRVEYDYKSSHNFDYKVRNGESINDVKKRASNALKTILKENYDKVVIVTHETTIVSILLNFCELGYNYDNKMILSYKDNVLFDSSMNANEIFVLEFDKKNILTIKKISV